MDLTHAAAYPSSRRARHNNGRFNCSTPCRRSTPRHGGKYRSACPDRGSRIGTAARTPPNRIPASGIGGRLVAPKRSLNWAMLCSRRRRRRGSETGSRGPSDTSSWPHKGDRVVLAPGIDTWKSASPTCGVREQRRRLDAAVARADEEHRLAVTPPRDCVPRECVAPRPRERRTPGGCRRELAQRLAVENQPVRCRIGLRTCLRRRFSKRAATASRLSRRSITKTVL